MFHGSVRKSRIDVGEIEISGMRFMSRSRLEKFKGLPGSVVSLGPRADTSSDGIKGPQMCCRKFLLLVWLMVKIPCPPDGPGRCSALLHLTETVDVK